MKIMPWIFYKKIILIFYFILAGSMVLALEGCASSSAARGAAGEADQAYLNTEYTIRHMGDNGPRDMYQNSSQVAKGVVIGGALGAAVGSTASGVGGVTGFGLGAVFGGAIGQYIDSHTTLADKLENRHVQVIELGDQIMLVLPSSVLFFENTSRLRGGAYEALGLVAQYISRFPNILVRVAAYTSAAEPASVVQSLSKQQANSVAKVLWQQHINTRLLVAEGRGGAKLVSPNTPNWANDNYRIEITLEKLPA